MCVSTTTGMWNHALCARKNLNRSGWHDFSDERIIQLFFFFSSFCIIITFMKNFVCFFPLAISQMPSSSMLHLEKSIKLMQSLSVGMKKGNETWNMRWNLGLVLFDQVRLIAVSADARRNGANGLSILSYCRSIYFQSLIRYISYISIFLLTYPA